METTKDLLLPELHFLGTAYSTTTLGKITYFANGKGYEHEQRSSGKYELINLNSVSIDGGLKSSGKFINNSEQTLLKNDLVMVLSDLAYGNFLGKVAIIPEDNKYVLNQRVALLRVINENIDPYYLFTYINAKQKYFKSMGAGTSQLNLGKDAVLNFPVSYPDFAEQKKIGNLFREVDTKIALLEQAWQTGQELKSSLIYKLLAVQANGQPQLRFTGFSQPWVKEKVKNVFDEITRGQVLAVSKMSSVATPEYKYPVYSSQTLNNGVIGYYKQYLFENAITWTTDGYAGRVTYRPGKFYSTNVNGVLISHRGLANKVIAEALNRVAHRYVAKGGIPKLMNNVMAIVEFEYPVEGEEQAKLSAFFTELDQLIDSYHRQLELYKKLKAALVQKVILP